MDKDLQTKLRETLKKADDITWKIEKIEEAKKAVEESAGQEVTVSSQNYYFSPADFFPEGEFADEFSKLLDNRIETLREEFDKIELPAD